MGNSIACQNLPEIADCIYSKEVDFEVIDVKKKFIRSKLINRNDIDKKFYKKVENLRETDKNYDFSRKNLLNNKLNNDIKANANPPPKSKKNYNFYNSQSGALIKKSTLESLDEENRIERNYKLKNNGKREYYNGSIKVLLFDDRHSSKNTIPAYTD